MYDKKNARPALAKKRSVQSQCARSICALLVSAIGFSAIAQPIDTKSIFKDAAEQTSLMLREIPAVRQANPQLVGPRTLNNGQLVLTPSFRWTSGFFAGTLWQLYAYTKDKKWKAAADTFSDLIVAEQYNGGTHDMGFKMYCSFGKGYQLTKDKRYKAILIQSAKTLRTRFNPNVGAIRSWDTMPKWGYPVIIDNMLNLELLFAATKLTGDSSYYKIAVSHANKTLANHFREDNSCFHVVDYDTLTGQVVKRNTHQGYSDASAWARGQAWAVYGFTMCYRETRDPRYLAHAEKVAAYILDHPRLPADKVPYWDFDAPGIPNEPRDASAAACIASGLYELARYSANKKTYLQAADQIVENLTNHYRSPIGQNKGFLLLHSTGAKPSNSEVDVPLVYADYYYLEALLRKNGKWGRK